MQKFRVPEIVLGILLAVAVFAMGMMFESSQPQLTNNPPNPYPKQVQTQQKPVPFSWDWLTHDGVVFFTCALVFVAGVQAYLFVRQLRYMRDGVRDAKIAADAAEKTAQAAIDANRPWIYLREARVQGAIRFRPGGAAITVEFEIQNVGKSPALDVQIKYRFFPIYEKTSNIAAVQTGIIDIVKSGAGDGVAVFPNDIQFHPRIASVLRSELEEVKPSSDGIRYGNFCIAGCIDYGFPSIAGRHQTTFWYFVNGPIQIRTDGDVSPIAITRIPANETAN